MQDLLTYSEVAALLRTPESTVRYWRHIGTGPTSFKIGRRVFFKRADVDAWLAHQQATTSIGAA